MSQNFSGYSEFLSNYRATDSRQKDRVKIWLEEGSQAPILDAEDETYYKSQISKISDDLTQMWKDTNMFVAGNKANFK